MLFFASKQGIQAQCDSAPSGIPGNGLSQRRLQAKLILGTSNDPLEKEADDVADQVLARPSNPMLRAEPTRIQRFTPQACAEFVSVPASVEHTLANAGRPLESTLRVDMEQRFGHDFSRVRVHSDAAAEQSARDVSAHAYTVGHNIVFGANRFAPPTAAGKRLIAHELTHVVQQTDISNVATVNATSASSMLQRQPQPVDPKQAYADALKQLKSIDAVLHTYLSATTLNGGSKTVRTGTGIDNSTTPPTTIKFSFDLDLKHDSALPTNTDAVFDPGVPTITPTASTTNITASMSMAINPAATSTSLATKLYHEGLHMILFMEDFLPSSPTSPHVGSFASYNKIAKAHKDFVAGMSEAEAFIDLDLTKRKQSKSGFAKKAAGEIAAHLLEEKYVFDQEKVKFGTPFTNRQLAATYVMEGFLAIGVSAAVSDKSVVSIFNKFAAVFDEIDKQTTSVPAPKPSSKPPAKKKP